VISYGTFQKLLTDNCLGIPEPGKSAGSTRKLPFIFTGYDAFAMKKDLLKAHKQHQACNN
jgi:hypothetical protein